MMSGNASSTVPTRFLIISDTHNFEFDPPNDSYALHHPLPNADVLLHCGDLTQVGGLSAYKKALKMLGTIPAELKLLIAGNHDLTLDSDYWRTHLDHNEGDDPEEHDKALEIMTGALATEAGVTYLQEGTYNFILSNGAKFTSYVSPYTPEFCDWAFPYSHREDRFNPPEHIAKGIKSIATNPIPNFPNVDIVMTHGPSKNMLDKCPSGNAGCEHLLRALGRARPRIHCFGHIHEGHGAVVKDWGAGEARLVNPYPEAMRYDGNFGGETLMINASIMDGKYEPVNKPWFLEMDLPKGG